MNRQVRVTVDTVALAHNLSIVKSVARQQKILAVIKADAYGHGMIEAARALSDADALAVAFVSEGVSLREAGIDKPILVLEGARHELEVAWASKAGLMLAVHNETQIRDLPDSLFLRPELWLKLDTGMGRLGFNPAEAGRLVQRLGERCTTVMTHFACADMPENPANDAQIACFEQARKNFDLPCSAANSAATFAFPHARYDWVRPGIVLYGSSPFRDESAADLGLLPVMTVRAPIIAINRHRKHDAIGYGGDYRCPADMPVGVIAAGYADGYPRHAQPGTPVLVNGVEVQLVGRVSMDMITVDLRPVPEVEVGDMVTLWGEGMPVDYVAARASTIAYELLCNAGAHAEIEYL
ncbi:MAG TPA: alanine racemase [Gammaproteobacteria bacterium]|nr:alanine racemase [Gammaproteobacteria bacterium]